MEKDIDIMARTLFGEAKANNVKDAEAIACVILNRVAYPNWPNTAAKVCQQKFQFSCWNKNDPNRERILNAKGKWFEQCKTIAANALAGKIKDPTKTSTHYHTPAVTPKWSVGKTPVYKTDGHIFFNDIDTPKPLSKSKTVKAQIAATASTAGIAAVEVAQNTQDAITPLVDYLEWAKYIFLGCIVVTAIATVLFKSQDYKKAAAE